MERGRTGKPDFVLVGEGKQRGPSPTASDNAAPEPALQLYDKQKHSRMRARESVYWPYAAVRRSIIRPRHK